MARGVETPAETEAGIAPRANPELVGHEGAEHELKRLYQSGRLPHAILFSGPRGIGKATLAFRFARFLLARDPDTAGEDRGLAIDPESGVFRRVASGGHADLLTIERGWDPRRRRLRGEILVDDTRQIAGFLHLTAAEGGWRVVVVDGADEMNRNAANALLKILEEPPRQALLLLVSHSPGRLLPTIRSRCRRFPLEPPPPEVVVRLVERYRPEIEAHECEALSALAGGSIGRALELADAGGVALYRQLIEMLSQMPRLDAVRLHGLVDRLVRPEADDAYRAAAELLSQFLARMAAGMARRQIPGGEIVFGEGEAMRRLAARADPARWAALREEIDDNFVRTEGLNLDRKQAMLGAFFAIESLAR